MTVAQHTPPPNPGVPHGQGVAQRHANRAHYSQNNDWAYNYTGAALISPYGAFQQSILASLRI
jgi:hypothetical protein